LNNLPLDKIVVGDCRAVMAKWPAESIDFVMFSPPYYGLRDYGTKVEAIWGGRPDCEHRWLTERVSLVHENRNFQQGTQEEVHGKKGTTYIKKYDDRVAAFCVKCGAWRGQLGLEPTWQMYVEHLVEVCRVVKRVLKPDGSMYIVIGDTYAGGSGHSTDGLHGRYGECGKPQDAARPQRKAYGIRPKCLIGIPWRLAFALIDDGWILRNDIIWYKPNHMPSSVKDRLTNSYEHIFHFVKQRKYYYDLDAIRIPHKTIESEQRRQAWNKPVRYDEKGKAGLRRDGRTRQELLHPKGRNPGDVVRVPKSWGVDQHGEYRGKAVKDYGAARAQNASEVKRRIIASFKKKPKGKNPGDVVSSDSKFLKHDVRTASPGARGILALKEGKLTTEVKRALQDVGQYLKDKRKESGLSFDELEALTGVKRTTLEHYFRTDFSGQALPSRQTWDLLKPLLNLGDYDDFIREELHSALPQPHPLGRNPSDFWSICTKPFKEAHFAVYPAEICVMPILAACPLGGIVVDPMVGSGTTCAVAKALGRHYIGIDLNSEYVEIAKKRVQQVIKPLTPITTLKEANQTVRAI